MTLAETRKRHSKEQGAEKKSGSTRSLQRDFQRFQSPGGIEMPVGKDIFGHTLQHRNSLKLLLGPTNLYVLPVLFALCSVSHRWLPAPGRFRSRQPHAIGRNEKDPAKGIQCFSDIDIQRLAGSPQGQISGPFWTSTCYQGNRPTPASETKEVLKEKCLAILSKMAVSARYLR